MTNKNPHVVPRNNGSQWAVTLEGNNRATSLFDTQKEAIELAQIIAIKNSTELIIHGRDGKIREKIAMEMIAFRQRDNPFLQLRICGWTVQLVSTILGHGKNVRVTPANRCEVCGRAPSGR